MAEASPLIKKQVDDIAALLGKKYCYKTSSKPKFDLGIASHPDPEVTLKAIDLYLKQPTQSNSKEEKEFSLQEFDLGIRPSGSPKASFWCAQKTRHLEQPLVECCIFNRLTTPFECFVYCTWLGNETYKPRSMKPFRLCKRSQAPIPKQT
jgi:hypothetical protein